MTKTKTNTRTSTSATERTHYGKTAKEIITLAEAERNPAKIAELRTWAQKRISDFAAKGQPSKVARWERVIARIDDKLGYAAPAKTTQKRTYTQAEVDAILAGKPLPAQKPKASSATKQDPRQAQRLAALEKAREAKAAKSVTGNKPKASVDPIDAILAATGLSVNQLIVALAARK